MVRGGRGQASDVQVGFAELVPACIAAAAAAVVARAGWSHGVWRRSNRWLFAIRGPWWVSGIGKNHPQIEIERVVSFLS